MLTGIGGSLRLARTRSQLEKVTHAPKRHTGVDQNDAVGIGTVSAPVHLVPSAYATLSFP